ncbi:MAG: LytTR family transcriptional regulator [Clostridia bacterium]|nr:LytTR family transcriptional regulator [Clostridia bacterium]
MKFSLFIDKEREEEVIVYARQKNKLADKIEELVMSENIELIGYTDHEIIPLKLSDIYAFSVEDGKVYATVENKKLVIKHRLYVIEEMLDNSFVKINQSCIVRIDKIKSFEASISGSLMVNMKNGYRDYVSRRQLKYVKERLGI